LSRSYAKPPFSTCQLLSISLSSRRFRRVLDWRARQTRRKLHCIVTSFSKFLPAIIILARGARVPDFSCFFLWNPPIFSCFLSDAPISSPAGNCLLKGIDPIPFSSTGLRSTSKIYVSALNVSFPPFCIFSSEVEGFFRFLDSLNL